MSFFGLEFFFYLKFFSQLLMDYINTNDILIYILVTRDDT